MNKVYLSEWDIFPLSNEALAAIASGGDSKFYKQLLPLYPDRITGNLCNCNGNGEFILLSHEKAVNTICIVKNAV